MKLSLLINRIFLLLLFAIGSVATSYGQITYRYLKVGGPNYTYTVPPDQCFSGESDCTFWWGTNNNFRWRDYGYAFSASASDAAITWTIPGAPGNVYPTSPYNNAGWGLGLPPAPVGTTFAPGSAGNNQFVYTYMRELRHLNTSTTARMSAGALITSYQISTVADLTFSPPTTICKSGPSITLNDYVNHAAGFGALKVVYSIDGTNMGSGSVPFNPSSFTAGNHTLTASMNFDNGITTLNRTITVIDAPTINTQPIALDVCNGGSGSFSVGAVANPGATSLNYNWEVSTNGGLGWTQLTEGSGPFGVHTGTTSATINLSGVATSRNGNLYRSKVTSQSSCAVTASSGVLLTVFGQVPITSHPVDRVICPGSNTTFVVAATAQSGSLTYQWQLSTNGGSSWSTITNGGVYSGATTATLTLTNPPGSYSAYKYRSVVQDGCGVINQNISNVANLTIQVTTSINTQPTNRIACSGTNTTFNSASVGTNLTYQWQESSNGGGSWSNLANVGIYSNVTTPILTLTNISPAVSGYQYRVQVVGTCGVVNSNAGTLTATGAPVVTADPVGGIICQTMPHTFTTISTGSGLSYQWEFSPSGAVGTYNNISGATSANYFISSASLAQSGYYRIKVTNSCGVATSGFAILTVNPNTAISVQPTNQNACPGSLASFSVTATGTGSVTYQWQVSTNGGSTYSNLSNTGIFSGVFTNTLTLNGVTPSYDTYRFRVIVASSCGSNVTSSAGTLSLNTVPVAPVAASVGRCGPGALSATASSPASSPTFKWYANDADIVPVYTGATYNVANLLTTTNYFVSVTSNGCESLKTEVTYTLNPLTPIDIGGPITLCLAQGPYNLNTDIADPAAVGNNFTWSVGGTNYSSTVFNPSVGAGVHVVTYTPSGSTTSIPKCYTPNTRTITVITDSGTGGITFDPTLVSTGNNLNLCIGDNPVMLNTLPSASGGFWSTVSGNGLSFNGTTAIFTPNTGSYTDVNPNVLRYTVVTGGCSASLDLNVYVKDNTSKPIVSGVPSAVCPGTNLSLNATVVSPGTYTYEWKKPPVVTPASTNSNYTFVVSKSETIDVRSINTFGCRSEATLIDIVTPFSSGNINPSQVLINTGEFVKFAYDVSVTGNTYSWAFGDGGTSSQREPIHYYYKPGTYDVSLTITSTLGCATVVNFTGINVQGDDIAANLVTGDIEVLPISSVVSVYPIPTGDVINLKSDVKIYEYTLSSLSGVISRTESFSNGTTGIAIDVPELASGVYLMKIRLERGTQITRIVKK